MEIVFLPILAANMRCGSHLQHVVDAVYILMGLLKMIHNLPTLTISLRV